MATAAACFVQDRHKSTVLTGQNGRENYVFAPEVSLTVTKFCAISHEISASWHHEMAQLCNER